MRIGTTPSADESAVILTDKIRDGEPFFFARIGDGAIECLDGPRSARHTTDGEVYTNSLRATIWQAIRGLRYRHSDVVWGDWATAVAGSAPRYVAKWESLCLDPYFHDSLVNYEALLLMRASHALVEFYAAVREDHRRKLFIGSPWVAKAAADMLRSEVLFVPGQPAHLAGSYPTIRAQIEEADPDVILFGAGMEGFAAVADYWVTRDRPMTCVHVGSALDPLFKGQTRSNQLPQVKARALFRDLLEAS